jgi:hypothetical protein
MMPYLLLNTDTLLLVSVVKGKERGGMGLYSISLSTELAFYGPSASQVLPCMRCIFPLLYFTVYE